MKEEYQEYTITHYGNQIEAYNKAYTDYAKNIIDWIENQEERERKRKEWQASPEGQAHLKMTRDIERKRYKFKKRWQRLHDWLNKNGCECNHDDCY